MFFTIQQWIVMAGVEASGNDITAICVCNSVQTIIIISKFTANHDSDSVAGILLCMILTYTSSGILPTNGRTQQRITALEIVAVVGIALVPNSDKNLTIAIELEINTILSSAGIEGFFRTGGTANDI
jgi:hypothetical protein